MRGRLFAVVAVLSALAPGLGQAVIPDAVPDLTLFGPQAARGAGLITSATATVTPTAKTADGNISDWTGDITRYAGTSIYSAGEYVYQDYLMDGWGADDGQDATRVALTDQANGLEPRTYRAEALPQAAGEQFGVECGETVCAVAHYGNVNDAAIRSEADIEEVRIAADDDALHFLIRTAGMTGSTTAALVLVDTKQGGSYAAPGGITTGAEHAFLVGGNAVLAESHEGVAIASCVECITVATNSSDFINAIEVSISRSALTDLPSTPRIAVATAVSDGNGGLSAVKSGDAKSDLLNVAFRFDEPQRIWMDRDQSLALRDGNIDRYLTPVDLGRLQSGYSQVFEPRPGYWERIYESESPVNVEQEINDYFQGRFQHYGVYLPSAYRPGSILPATWWTHYRGGHAHDAAAWVPGLLRQFGEAKNNIMIFPSARGTSSWYVGRGQEDFLQVWDDAMSAFPIDPDRVYMTGYSMGGFASWLFPMLYPDRFAGASPQDGAVTQGMWLGTPQNESDPSQGANGGDAQAELLYNVIENARNVPYVIYHGTDDELAPISGVLAMQAKFVELGYRHRMYALVGAEHYTAAIMDRWEEAANYLNRFRRDPNPARVTYRTWPALERAVSTISVNNASLDLGYRFNRAYWVSGLEVRNVEHLSDGRPDPKSWGTIDAVTNGRGTAEVLTIPEAGVGEQGTPYQMTGLAWLGNGRTAPRNTFTATLTNLSAGTLDLAGMGLATGAQIAGSITTDGPTELVLTGAWDAAPQVVGATATYAGNTLRITLPQAGTYALTIG
ncbi:MAG: prolyl oligopeptidase family serine peptidase [Actinomycetota bacterium]